MMLKKSDTALFVIDVQGKLARIMHQADEYVANLKKLIRGAQVLGIPIIWTEQLPEKSLPLKTPMFLLDYKSEL